jgi:hypothetical protein
MMQDFEMWKKHESARLRAGLETFTPEVRREIVRIIAERVLMHDVLSYLKDTDRIWFEHNDELHEIDELIAKNVAVFYLTEAMEQDMSNISLVSMLTDEEVQFQIIKLIRFAGDEK